MIKTFIGIVVGIMLCGNAQEIKASETYYTTANVNYRLFPIVAPTNICGTIERGEAVQVEQTKGQWSQVIIDGKGYYMYSDYLSKEKTEKSFLGYYELTAYCNCTQCTQGLGITASGTSPKQGRTVAINGIPFGTKVYLEGYGTYTVEDRGGMGYGVVDVYFNSHSDALKFGRKKGVAVYIVN